MKLFLILLIGIQILVNICEGVELNCTSSDDCYCFEVNSHYEFYCPIEIPKILLKVQPNEGVSIQCLNQDNSSKIELEQPFLNLPSFSDALKEINFLKFELCLLPKKFSNLIISLGITRVKILEFLYDDQIQNLNLHRDTFENLRSLEELTLSRRNLEDNFTLAKLSKNVFDNLPNLIKLDLSRNQLINLNEQLFSKNNKLKQLYLRSNRLFNLSSKIFEKLQQLELLDLSNNQLENLPKSLFKNLINLKYVNLMSNKLKTIPKMLFAANRNLEVVRLNQNPLTQLYDIHFANFSNLEEFGLNEGELTSLPNYLFQGSNNLLIIDLHSNNLEILPKDAFHGLAKLQFLNLSFNKLKNLHQNLFGSLISLLTLNLEYNSIKHLNKNIFGKLRDVETINLKRNQLETLHKDLFQNTVNLQEIILADNLLQFSNNTIRAFTSSPFIFNENLRKLDLSSNKLTAINDDWVLNKPYLKELDLSYNHITFLAFENLFAVSEKISIDLSHNNISMVDFQNAIEISLKKKKYIQKKSITVFLDENPLDCNCFIYDFLKCLDGRSIVSEFMQIEADNLTCYGPDSLYNTSIRDLKLDNLKCSFHELEMENCSNDCTCSFRPSDSTVLLDCSKRNLTNYPAFEMPSTLEFNRTEVDLQHNQLTFGLFDGLGYENVTKLLLSFNSISDLKWLPAKLETLELDHNDLSSLETSVLNSSLLKNINLGNNPWRCNCTNINLYNFLINHLTTKNIDSNDIRCKKSNIKLINLSSKELCPTSDYIIIGLSTILLVLMMVICVLLIFYYRNEHKIKVWLFAHNIFLALITEEEIDKSKIYDAFISYSHKDEDFVLNQLQECLEKEPNSYKLCLHVRDWIPGETICEQIIKSVNTSKRTVVVLSRNFLESVWGTLEFQTAHSQAMSEGRARLIVILYGELNLNEELDDTLRTYIQTNTYVKWGDPWFWDKLKYALPHAQKRLEK